MSEYALQFATSNWCLSTLIAIAAWIAQRYLRQPGIAHLLWLLVLIKLVTPPLLTLPIVPLPGVEAATLAATNTATADAAPAMLAAEPMPVAAAVGAKSAWTAALLWAWLLGSLVTLAWSSYRIIRFDRLLQQSSRRAPVAMQQAARMLAGRLGIGRTPEVRVTTARVTPMVWWRLGAPARIFVPAELITAIDASQMRWILAHELGHVRRGDHYVRWLEWLSCIAFWWNPIAWWARRNLRANEEVCCDALVLRSFEGTARSYANSLLAAVEFLAAPGIRPPALASEINSGGFLERRFRMIVSKTPLKATPRWLQAAMLLGTIGLLPIGVAYAQDPDVNAVGKRLERAIKAGELTKEQARTMLGALKKSTSRKGDWSNRRGRAGVAGGGAGDGWSAGESARKLQATKKQLEQLEKMHAELRASLNQNSTNNITLKNLFEREQREHEAQRKAAEHARRTQLRDMAEALNEEHAQGAHLKKRAREARRHYEEALRLERESAKAAERDARELKTVGRDVRTAEQDLERERRIIERKQRELQEKERELHDAARALERKAAERRSRSGRRGGSGRTRADARRGSGLSGDARGGSTRRGGNARSDRDSTFDRRSNVNFDSSSSSSSNSSHDSSSSRSSDSARSSDRSGKRNTAGRRRGAGLGGGAGVGIGGAAGARPAPAKVADAAKKIEALVKSGRLTKQQAVKKLRELEKRHVDELRARAAKKAKKSRVFDR